MSDLSDFKRIVHDPQVRALREKSRELRASLQAAEAEADKYRKATDQQARRAEAAEARLVELLEGRDYETWARRVEAAEAEVQRYREGLREIEQTPLGHKRLTDGEIIVAIRAKARALLSASPDGTWNNPGPEGLIEERGPLAGGGAK